jgi:hypothetical protein
MRFISTIRSLKGIRVASAQRAGAKTLNTRIIETRCIQHKGKIEYFIKIINDSFSS